MKHKFVFLIIAGNDDVVTKLEGTRYLHFENKSRQYFNIMKNIYDFEYYFIKYSESITKDIELDNNCILLKGKEEFSKIYEKTIKGINFINSIMSYDYLIRTNLSSFWNIEYLYSHLKLPATGCLSGIYIFNSFISGTGIIMSRDVCDVLVTKPNIQNVPDDVLISNHLKPHFQITKLNDKLMLYLISDADKIPSNIDDILYFRVKNSNNREVDCENFDVIFRKLCNN